MALLFNVLWRGRGGGVHDVSQENKRDIYLSEGQISMTYTGIPMYTQVILLSPAGSGDYNLQHVYVRL